MISSLCWSHISFGIRGAFAGIVGKEATKTGWNPNLDSYEKIKKVFFWERWYLLNIPCLLHVSCRSDWPRPKSVFRGTASFSRRPTALPESGLLCREFTWLVFTSLELNAALSFAWSNIWFRYGSTLITWAITTIWFTRLSCSICPEAETRIWFGLGIYNMPHIQLHEETVSFPRSEDALVDRHITIIHLASHHWNFVPSWHLGSCHTYL